MKDKMSKAFELKGSLRKKKYFEGWYFKMVSEDLSKTLALIPGISLNKTDSHAFIQIIYCDRSKKKSQMITEYVRYDINQFAYNKSTLEVKIDNNIFSPNRAALNIKSDKVTLLGEITFKDTQLINTSIFSPSIMGPFHYFPFMECNHSVVSMSHHLESNIMFNGEQLLLTNGKGYIEKDYGKSFPVNYIWTQSNNFTDNSTSLIFSLATIPFLGFKFRGLIAVFKYKLKEYRFATYNFSIVKALLIEDKHVKVVLKKGKHLLDLDIYIDETNELPSPKEGVMNQTIKEGLSGRVELSFYYKKRLVYKDTGESAGVEIMM